MCRSNVSVRCCDGLCHVQSAWCLVFILCCQSSQLHTVVQALAASFSMHVHVHAMSSKGLDPSCNTLIKRVNNIVTGGSIGDHLGIIVRIIVRIIARIILGLSRDHHHHPWRRMSTGVAEGFKTSCGSCRGGWQSFGDDDATGDDCPVVFRMAAYVNVLSLTRFT